MVLSVSVVVCTRNRVDRLRRCVEALLSVKTATDWQLVLVDNASTDGTAAFLRSLHRYGNQPSLKIVTEARPGKGRAQNAGWKNADSAIVAFTDDDCYVTPGYVDAIIAAFDRIDIGFVGGQVLLYDREDFPITITTRVAPFDLHPNTFVAAGDLLGANMAFRREVLQHIGGFDDEFGPGTKFVGDDTDVQARAVWNGFAGAYDPSIVVFHHHGRKAQSVELRKLMRYYAFGRGAYYAKMVLGKRSRRTYLRIWKIKTLEDFRSVRTFKDRWAVFIILARELAGAMQYLLHVTLKPSKVPAP